MVTAYKRPEMLDLTLKSLSEQTRPPDELIVADDCSPDRTGEVAGRWRRRFRNFRYSRSEVNLNMPGNLNRGIAEARGEYVANLHHADLCDPALLEKWEAALNRYPTAGFVFSGAENVYYGSNRPNSIHLESISPLSAGVDFFRRHYVGSMSGPVWGTVMARRSAYEKLGPFDPQFGPWSDVDMWMRMCGSFDVAYIREPLLKLDMAPSPWKEFHWEKHLLHDRMVTLNIRRIFRENPKELRRCLRKQRNYFRLFCWRTFGWSIYRRLWHVAGSAGPVFRRVYFTPYSVDL